MPWNREDVLPFKVCYVDLPDFSILRTFASHQFRVSSRMITGCVVITHLLCLCAHSCVLIWTFKWNSIKVCHHHTPLCAAELTRCARETHLILECTVQNKISVSNTISKMSSVPWSRLWEVPHFPSGIAERGKCKRMWKSHHVRNARSGGGEKNERPQKKPNLLTLCVALTIFYSG